MDSEGARAPGGWMSRTRVQVVLALLAGLVLRLWFIAWHGYVVGDSLVYGDIAKNLLLHGVYGFTNVVNGVVMAPHATLIRLPGYPLFLAGVFAVFGVDRYAAVMVVQAVVDVAGCCAIGAVAARVWGPRAGVWGVWLAALNPFTANYVAAPLTETLTIFTVSTTFYFVVIWRERLVKDGQGTAWAWVGVAAALGYSILLRPDQGLLAAAVVPALGWMAWRAEGMRGVWRRVLPVAVLTVLPLAPWMVRNWRTFRVVQPLAPRFANDPGEVNPAGFQRWYRTWGIDFASTDEVYWNYDGNAVRVTDLPDRAFDSQAQYEQTAALLESYDDTNVATAAMDKAFDRLAGERIRANPLRYYVALPVARLLNMCFRPRVEMLPAPLEWWKASWGVALACWLYAGLNAALFGAAGWGLWWLWRTGAAGPVVWGMVAFCVLRCGLLLTLDNSEPRYTLEMMPVLMVLAAGVFVAGQRDWWPGGELLNAAQDG